MNFSFVGKRISGVLTVVPENESLFDDEIDNYDFSELKSRQLKRVMGFDRHRIVAADTCASDLCLFGLRSLIDRQMLEPEEIDALILVTQSPDHFIPPTSNIIQGALKLKHDCFCLDINQGCAGYLVGLIQAFLLLDQPSIRKVVLLNADTLSRKSSRRDRNIFPMTGDAASVTIVEKTEDDRPIFANLKMDGTRSRALTIPAGGFRIPATAETAKPADVGDNNWRSQDDFFMNGSDVFNFVQTEVPPMIDSLLEFAGRGKGDVDYFIFHQPNKFMLEKLAAKLDVSCEKMPNNTIPTCLCSNLDATLTSPGATRLCLAGFGVGLTWSSMLIDAGDLRFCEIIDYPEESSMRQAA